MEQSEPVVSVALDEPPPATRTAALQEAQSNSPHVSSHWSAIENLRVKGALPSMISTGAFDYPKERARPIGILNDDAGRFIDLDQFLEGFPTGRGLRLL